MSTKGTVEGKQCYVELVEVKHGSLLVNFEHESK